MPRIIKLSSLDVDELFELLHSPDTNPEVREKIRRFLVRRMGQDVNE